MTINELEEKINEFTSKYNNVFGTQYTICQLTELIKHIETNINNLREIDETNN